MSKRKIQRRSREQAPSQVERAGAPLAPGDRYRSVAGLVGEEAAGPTEQKWLLDELSRPGGMSRGIFYTAIGLLRSKTNPLEAALESDQAWVRARALCYQGQDEPDEERARSLYHQAIELHPECVAALLCHHGTQDDPADRLTGLLAAAEIAHRQAADDPGEVVQVIAAMDYCDVLEMLAREQLEQGLLPEALATAESMRTYHYLPEQGQTLLVSCLLANGLTAEAKDEIQAAETPHTPFLAYARVLERWLAGDPGAAGRLRARALDAWDGLDELLLENDSQPFLDGELHSDADLDDALADLAQIAELALAWRAHPEALAWLREKAGVVG